MTTTVAGWSQELECAWYTLDSSDDTLSVLAHGLADALVLGDMAELPATGQDLQAGRAREPALRGARKHPGK